MRYILLIALLISSMAVSSQVDDCQRWKEYGMLCGKFSVSDTNNKIKSTKAILLNG